MVLTIGTSRWRLFGRSVQHMNDNNTSSYRSTHLGQGSQVSWGPQTALDTGLEAYPGRFDKYADTCAIAYADLRLPQPVGRVSYERVIARSSTHLPEAHEVDDVQRATRHQLSRQRTNQ